MSKALYIFDVDNTLTTISSVIPNALLSAFKQFFSSLQNVAITTECIFLSSNTFNNLETILQPLTAYLQANGVSFSIYSENGHTASSSSSSSLEQAFINSVLIGIEMIGLKHTHELLTRKSISISYDTTDMKETNMQLKMNILKHRKQLELCVTVGPTNIEFFPLNKTKGSFLQQYISDKTFSSVTYVGDQMYALGNDISVVESVIALFLKGGHTCLFQSVSEWNLFSVRNVLDTAYLLSHRFEDDVHRCPRLNIARSMVAHEVEEMFRFSPLQFGMASLTEFTQKRHEIDTIWIDFDGTFIDSGSCISADLLESIHKWKATSKCVKNMIIVTGRSTGWCETLIRILPIDTIIGENGAVWFSKDKTTNAITQGWCINESDKSSMMAAQKMLLDRIRTEWPDVQLALDQPSRQIDIAINLKEDGADSMQMTNPARWCVFLDWLTQNEFTFKSGNIHLNAWKATNSDCLPMNKWQAIVHVARKQKLDYCKRSIFIGDSSNDECVFEQLPLSFGVQNLLDVDTYLNHMPAYLLDKRGPEGVIQLLDHLTAVAPSIHIGIVVPCFMELENLDRALGALAYSIEKAPPQQATFQVILINNNSPEREKLLSMWQKWSAIFPCPLQIDHQKRKDISFALCSARNMGAAHIRQRINKNNINSIWIHCLDADCVVPPLYYSHLVERIALHKQHKQQQPFIFIGERRFIYPDQKITGVDMQKDLPRYMDEFERSKVKSPSNYGLSVDRRTPHWSTLQSGIHPHPWAVCHGGNVVISMAQWENTGGCDELYDGQWGYEDVDLAYRILSHETRPSTRVSYEKELYVYHQDPPTSAGNVDNSCAKRFDKVNNPNWARICNSIPGFRDYKQQEYRSLSSNILV